MKSILLVFLLALLTFTINNAYVLELSGKIGLRNFMDSPWQEVDA
jgi:hypothetical protein